MATDGGSDSSKDLHAFPDHEVVRTGLKGIENRRLTREQAVEAIGGDPGWMPVAVDPEEKAIYFVNVGERSLDRWQFVYSIRALAEEEEPPGSFSVDFDVLDHLKAA